MRVLAPSLEPNPFVRTIEESGPDELSIRIQGGSEVLTIPLDLVSTLERSAGLRSRVWPGALIGFAVGAVTGYAVSTCDYGEGCIDDLELIVSPAFGLIAAGVGALIGSRIKEEAWEPVTWTVTSSGQTRMTIRLGVGHPNH